MTRNTIAAFAATLLVACATAAAAQAVDGLDRLEAMEAAKESDDWMVNMSLADRARWDANKDSISSHPIMTNMALGLRYDPIWDLPLMTFHEELGEDDSEDLSVAAEIIISKFNIQLISTWARIDWPATATLTIDFSKNGANSSIPVEMDLREGNSYYISDVSSFISNLIDVMSSIGRYPRMELSRFDGFVFNESTIHGMPPLGVPVTYNVRIGSVRVDTDFQWAGRPSTIPINGGRDFLK